MMTLFFQRGQFTPLGNQQKSATWPAMSAATTTTPSATDTTTDTTNTSDSSVTNRTSPSSVSTVMVEDKVQNVSLQKLPELVEKLTDVLDNSSLTNVERAKFLRQRGQCHFRVGWISKVHGVMIAFYRMILIFKKKFKKQKFTIMNKGPDRLLRYCRTIDSLWRHQWMTWCVW